MNRLMPDNARSIVLRASRAELQLNLAFRDYADARGFFGTPALVQSPKSAARIKNQAPYIRKRWFAGETLSVELCNLRRLKPPPQNRQ